MSSTPLSARRAVLDERGSEDTGAHGAERIFPLAGAPAHVYLAVVLAVVGVLSIWPTALLLWSLWITDPLKCIGALVPVISLLLTLRVWRSLGWETHGSWWGAPVLLVTIAAVRLRDGAVLELVLSPSWSLTLPPHSVVALAYASGLVLLIGGGRLWRAAWFPVMLMLLVNPVPHVFNRWIDLPLQHASAAVARSLAHALGQQLTPDQLYLMFTPDFGMFIAPGCNGMRGAVTMGLIALIAGYLYRFRLRAWAGVVAGAVLLGYAFNLIRLCALVLYYVVALHLPWLQGHAEGADYLIGACLFFFATMLLFAVVRRMNPRGNLEIPRLTFASRDVTEAGSHRFITSRWRLGALAVLLLAGAAPYLHAFRRSGPPELPTVRFPETVGTYRLQRTWTERLDTGQVIFVWATYSGSQAGGPQDAVDVGVSPVLGAHDTLLCHVARGESWIWRGSLPLATQIGAVTFSGTLFNNGAVQYMEASTLCAGERCGEWSSDHPHLGLVYSRPDPRQLLKAEATRPVPILLRVETTNALLPAAAARKQLTDELQRFAASASFASFAYRYPQP